MACSHGTQYVHSTFSSEQTFETFYLSTLTIHAILQGTFSSVQSTSRNKQTFETFYLLTLLLLLGRQQHVTPAPIPPTPPTISLCILIHDNVVLPARRFQ